MVTVYVSMLRATPLVTLLLLLFFALPNIGVPIDPISAAILALVHEHLGVQLRGLARRADGVPEGPVRGGAVGRACAPDSASAASCCRRSSRASLPGLVNEMSLLIKVTPVLAVVGVVDITRAAVRIGAETYEPLPPFLVAVALYVPIVFALVSLQRWIERRQCGGGRRMIHDFGIVWSERALLLSGLANTTILSVLAATVRAAARLRADARPDVAAARGRRWRRARLRRRHALRAVPAVRLHRLLRPAVVRAAAATTGAPGSPR